MLKTFFVIAWSKLSFKMNRLRCLPKVMRFIFSVRELGKHIFFFICGGIYSKVTQNEWHLMAYMSSTNCLQYNVSHVTNFRKYELVIIPDSYENSWYQSLRNMIWRTLWRCFNWQEIFHKGSSRRGNVCEHFVLKDLHLFIFIRVLVHSYRGQQQRVFSLFITSQCRPPSQKSSLSVMMVI